MNYSARNQSLTRLLRLCVVLSLFVLVVARAAQNVNKLKKNIPVSALRKLSACNSTSEVFRKYVVRKHRQEPDAGQKPEQIPGEDFIFRPDGTFNPIALLIMENSEPLVDCKPRLSVVPLPNDPQPDVILHPACAELNQCSGCCDDLLECMATSTQIVYKKPSRLQYDPATDRFEFIGFANVSLEEHLACECNCKVQPESCNVAIHWYDSSSCQCRCQATAQVCNPPKSWSEEQCDCVCPNVTYCLEDEVYDFQTCSCQARSSTLPAAGAESGAAK